MATKSARPSGGKVVPKKGAKAAPPAKKTPAKPARPANGKIVASKKTSAPAKKVAPVKAKAAVKKAPAKPPVKAKPVAVAKKPVTQKSVPQPAKKMAIPAKPLAKTVAKEAPPVKKPVIAASTQHHAKAATKPLESKPAVKEPAKPVKVVIPKTSTDKKIKYEPDFTRSVLDAQKGGENTPTMRYSDAELTEFRELINRKLDVAKKELAYLQGLITRKDESGDLDEGRYMTMEDGSMSMEREQLSQMASRQIQFIDHLEKAIMRIENKTYGICRVTGKLIDNARLRAVPHATLSIEAKQMMNK